ncbi:MAG: hypothetical protein K6U11_13735 [bacterium]|nr:hypothetical protein [bacterium]
MERYLKKLSLVVCMMVALVAMVGLQTKVAWAAKEILIIQKNTTTYTYGGKCAGDSLADALAQLNKHDLYDVKDHTQFSTMSLYELSRYRIIIIAENQTEPDFYSTLALAQNREKLAKAVEGGCILLAHMYDNSDNGSQVDGYTNILPGGVRVYGIQQNANYTTNAIEVSDPGACVLTGILSPDSYFSGLNDTLCPDLNYSASGIFGNIPPDATKVMRADDGVPNEYTYIIYKWGEGYVFATTQPIEGMYCDCDTDREKFLKNEIICAQAQAQPGEVEQMLKDIKAAIAILEAKADTMEGKLDAIQAQTDKITTIKTNTDMIPGIQTQTSGIPAIGSNVSGIKEQTDKIPAIKTETDKIGTIVTQTAGISAIGTNVSGIKEQTDKIPAIKTETDKIGTIVTQTAGIPAIGTAVGNIKTNTDTIPAIKTETDKIPSIKSGVDALEVKIDRRWWRSSTLPSLPDRPWRQ